MNFSIFPVGSTNIFPLANDTKNGQLMTEFNLKSRESVGTPSVVKYMIGPSFAHSESDFQVRVQSDAAGVPVSSSILEVTGGRAIVDGHFFESLVSVTIDMIEFNQYAKTNGLEPLKGKLSVGLRAMYSTRQTMAGSMLTYNKDEYYEGIQLVILPRDKFKLPIDCPTEQDKVTAHLKLADFDFVNGSVSAVKSYPGKIQSVSADRIANVDRLLSDTYVKKSGLNPKKLYTFAGKGTNPATGLDTWCDSTDALMTWDANPVLTHNKPTLREAAFGTTLSGRTQLYVPHKQVDGMVDTAGNSQYYADKAYDLPLADYSKGTAGTVNRDYTNHIKAISEELNNIYRLPNGKQVGFIEILNAKEDLPTINPNWSIGDYVLVGQDNTLDETTDGVSSPSTMYVLLPGIVSAYKFHSMVRNSSAVPSSLTGIEIARYDMNADNGDIINTTDPEVYKTYFDLTPGYRGSINTDYFMIHFTEGEEYTRYYFSVSESGARGYSVPMQITGQIPFAQESVIGGFLNVNETTLDGGYVYRDETGHLRLLDYQLLRSGTLAYQLGEDFAVPAGVSHEEVQANLDEYVNERVAFPNYNQTQNKADPNVIDIKIDLSPEETETTINLHDIDSRFNTSIYLHINGTADNKCTINISDCEKLRIDSNIGGSPIINIYRCNLYYDAHVIEALNTIQYMSLWYEKYESTDPDLLVDNMTVSAIDEPIIPDEIDYWNTSAPNDNHYMYALHSITFAPDGTIVGCKMYIKNETSNNIAEGRSVVTSKFVLPQGSGLIYPKSKLTRQLKITGSFVNAYPTDSGYMVLDTNFSAVTNKVSAYDTTNATDGVIAFYVDANLVDSVTGLPIGTELDCWDSNAYHVFQGVAI